MSHLSFAAIRLQALNISPYLGPALWNVHPVPTEGLGTFACDKYWRVYYDPVKATEWKVHQSAMALIHEVWHLLRKHHERAENFKPEDSHAWNIAVDMEINDDLRDYPQSLPDIAIYPDAHGYPDGKSAEQYYNMFPDQGMPSPVFCDCGSGAGGKPIDGELPGSPDGADSTDEQQVDVPAVSSQDAELITRQVAETISKTEPGKLPKSIKRWADKELTPTPPDPRKVLAATIRRSISHAAGRVDYSYRRISRRQSSHVILPGMIKPVPKVGFVIDTSGSISQNDLNEAMAFIDACFTKAGIKDAHVTVCDAAISQSRKIIKSGQINLQGGGGTDMRVGYEDVCKSKPDVVVILTDGYTPWPDEWPVSAIVALIGRYSTPGPDHSRVRTINLHQDI